MTDTKFLWIFSTWQHSWCLATGYPSWIPTFTLFCTRLSAATAPTAAVTTRIRVHLTRLSRLFHLNRSPSSGLFTVQWEVKSRSKKYILLMFMRNNPWHLVSVPLKNSEIWSVCVFMNGGSSTYGQFYQKLYIIKKDLKSRWGHVVF